MGNWMEWEVTVESPTGNGIVNVAATELVAGYRFEFIFSWIAGRCFLSFWPGSGTGPFGYVDALSIGAVVRIQADYGVRFWVEGGEFKPYPNPFTGRMPGPVYGGLGFETSTAAANPVNVHYALTGNGLDTEWAETDDASEWGVNAYWAYASREADGWTGVYSTGSPSNYGAVGSKSFAIRSGAPVRHDKAADGTHYALVEDAQGTAAFAGTWHPGMQWSAVAAATKLAKWVGDDKPTDGAASAGVGSFPRCYPTGLVAYPALSLAATRPAVRGDGVWGFGSIAASVASGYNRIRAYYSTNPTATSLGESTVLDTPLASPRDPDDPLVPSYLMARPDGLMEAGILIGGQQKLYTSPMETTPAWTLAVDEAFDRTMVTSLDAAVGADGSQCLVFCDTEAANIYAASRNAFGAAWGASVLVAEPGVCTWPIVYQAETGAWYILARIARVWRQWTAGSPAGPWGEVV